jgi:hypothetical protein
MNSYCTERNKTLKPLIDPVSLMNPVSDEEFVINYLHLYRCTDSMPFIDNPIRELSLLQLL